MAEIPTEALQAAAQAHLLAAVSQATSHTVGCICQRCEGLAAAYLIAEGRRQVIAELRQLVTPAGPLFTPLQIVMFLEGRASVGSLALRDYQPDDRDRLMARYERELRAKIAGEIRGVAAGYLKRADEDDSLTGRTVLNVKAEAVLHVAEIVEGSDDG